MCSSVDQGGCGCRDYGILVSYSRSSYRDSVGHGSYSGSYNYSLTDWVNETILVHIFGETLERIGTETFRCVHCVTESQGERTCGFPRGNMGGRRGTKAGA